MHSQNNTVQHSKLSTQTIKQDYVNDLMKSIQNKLSMMACDDSIGNFQASKMQSPKRQYYTATNEKKNNQNRLNIHDLDTSVRKSLNQSPNKLGESRIVSRINQIQHFYMDKIQQMSTKIANLQFQLQNVNKLNDELKRQNVFIKQKLQRKQRQQTQIITHKIQQLKLGLIQKFAKEAEQHFHEHIKQMKYINQQLQEQKGKRKYLEQQVSLLKNQKGNLQQFYKNLLDSHRHMIKLDIQKSQKMVKQQQQHNESSNKSENQLHQSNIGKKKTKRHKNNQTKRQQMTKQQMIPFLAKGIQDLKDKLKIK